MGNWETETKQLGCSFRKHAFFSVWRLPPCKYHRC